MSTGNQLIAEREQYMLQKADNIRLLVPDFLSEAERAAFPQKLVRFMVVAMYESWRKKKSQNDASLLDCTPESLYMAALGCTRMGLYPGGPRPDVYLVAFGAEAIPMTDYRCEVRLVLEANPLVRSIEAKAVYGGETFDHAYGTSPFLTHASKQDVVHTGEKVIAAWALATYKDGYKQFEVMWKDQIDRIRNKSRAKSGPMWMQDYDMAARKTVVRRLCNLMSQDVSAKAAAQIRAIHEIEDMAAEAPLALDPKQVDVIPATRMEAIGLKLGVPVEAPEEPEEPKPPEPQDLSLAEADRLRSVIETMCKNIKKEKQLRETTGNFNDPVSVILAPMSLDQLVELKEGLES